MLIYRIIAEEGGVGRYYPGQTECSKVARKESESGDVVSVYEYSTPKVVMDKSTFLAALNEEEWCEPTLVAQYENGRTKKLDKP